MARPRSDPPPEPGGQAAGGWTLTLRRSAFSLHEPEERLRILKPVLTELPAWLREAAAAAGAHPEPWGDRLSLLGDPEALLASSGLLPDFRSALEGLLARRAPRRFGLDLGRGRRLELGDPPVLFGILNATPDSFSDGGLNLDPGRALDAALAMAEEGAEVIDVGGESTRPGAVPVDAAEERRRVEPVIRRIRAASPIPLSIDTTKAEVARMALAEGADILNDVSALRDDPAMPALARESGAPVILMHRQGTPRDMQENPRYHDVTREVYEFLAERVRVLSGEGLDPEKMVVDPGIGFGKRVYHNLTLLRDIDELRSLGRPVLVGASRKSFLTRALDRPERETDPARRGTAPLSATLAAHAAAALGGAAALRVHDVAQHRDLIRALWAIARPPRPAGE